MRPRSPWWLLLFLLGGPLFLLPRGRSSPLPSPIHLPAEGELVYEVRDGDTGQLIPAKLTLLGTTGSPDPQLAQEGLAPGLALSELVHLDSHEDGRCHSHTDIGRQEGDAIVAYNRIMSASGSGAAHVPYGTYDVYVSRGPEWDLFASRGVQIGAGEVQVRAVLHHVVQTAGWLSADFHVHSSCSSDSRVPLMDRVYEFLSDGVGMIVSTDHNTICDYAPIIAEMGVEREILSATGDELTTTDWGHFGGFPLAQDPDRAGNGAIRVAGRTPAEVFHDVRAQAPDAVIDIHHPRMHGGLGYFNAGGLDSGGGRAGRPGFSFDFDAVEVLNGYAAPDRDVLDQTLQDWFALIGHGHIVTATGNSDTHHLIHNIGGYPRNYVRVATDLPTPREVARALKAHHALFTTGPFVRFEAGGAGIGELAAAAGGRVRAELQVDAAPWVAVSKVTLYVNGRQQRAWVVPESTAVTRLREQVDLAVEGDAYLVVRVDGDRPLEPVVGERGVFEIYPLAITNPIFVDADGDGRYDPPPPG